MVLALDGDEAGQRAAQQLHQHHAAQVARSAARALTHGVLRGLTLLKAFYDAPGRSLTATQASAAARAAGYDPRGTAGFYVGNGSLKKVDESRGLTKVGREWYKANAPAYAAELGIDDE